jgi:hypothetical protein
MLSLQACDILAHQMHYFAHDESVLRPTFLHKPHSADWARPHCASLVHQPVTSVFAGVLAQIPCGYLRTVIYPNCRHGQLERGWSQRGFGLEGLRR